MCYQLASSFLVCTCKVYTPSRLLVVVPNLEPIILDQTISRSLYSSQQRNASDIEANTVTAMGASFEALRQQFNQLQQTADALHANNTTTQGAHNEGI